MNTINSTNPVEIFKATTDIWFRSEIKYLTKCTSRRDYFNADRTGETLPLHRADRAKVWAKWERSLDIASDNMGE